MIEVPIINEAEVRPAIYESRETIESLSNFIMQHQQFGLFGAQAPHSFDGDTKHDLGMLDSLLRQVGFKEDISFTVEDSKRFLYTFQGKDIGIVKILYSIYQEMSKLPIRFYGIGVEVADFFEHSQLAYCSFLNGTLYMDMLDVPLRHNRRNVEPLRKAYKRLPVKEKALLTMTHPHMSDLFHKVEVVLSEQDKELL